MLKLCIFRHGKSDWDAGVKSDRDRPLNSRGIKAVPRMARFMAEQGLVPKKILCSPALRTRETLDLMLQAFEATPTVQFLEPIYDAEADVLLGLTKQTKGAASPLMLVGHNPGVQELALMLAAIPETDESNSAYGRLALKFPTAGLAVITFPVAAWSRIEPGAGTLTHFITPKTLKEAG